jgi:hypothetical protein
MWYMFSCQPLPDDYKWLALGFAIGLMAFVLYKIFKTPVMDKQ